VTIHRFLQNTPLDPEEIERLVSAYPSNLARCWRMIAKKIAVFQKSGLARYFAHSFLTDHTGTVSVVSYGTERFPAG
jgi:hypothetical protein